MRRTVLIVKVAITAVMGDINDVREDKEHLDEQVQHQIQESAEKLKDK